MKPLLKWPGGKQWAIKYIQPAWEAWETETDQQGTFVELFSGSAVVALALEPTRALLNDKNASAVSVYLNAANGVLTTFPDALERYYEYRQLYNDLRGVPGKMIDRTNLFWLLNKCGYNGLVRYNRKGEFNVPKGQYKRPSRYYNVSLDNYRELLQFWAFSSVDFANVPLRGRDFVYADPPYYGVFDQYTPEGFTKDDHARLAETLSRHVGPVVTTNSFRTYITSLYEGYGFTIHKVKSRRTISRDGEGRKPVWDMIACKNIELEV